MNITELIKEDYKKWGYGQNILIEAGTGKGKSHFIKNTLYKYAKDNNKNILLFSNRINLLNQNVHELGDRLDGYTITVRNYQKLHHQAKRGELDLYKFDYVVCDECHYFFTDSVFNRFTDIALITILESKACKIFMSATPRLFKSYIEEKGLDYTPYETGTNYSHVNKLYFYKDPMCIEDNLLDNLPVDEKVLYFNTSATDCLRLHNKYKANSMINVSEGNKLYQFVDVEAKQNMLKQCKFDSQILFTTSCLDNGVNLIDASIKHIVVDIKDIDILIQCIGRKRVIDENDTVTLYIRNISNESLGGTYRDTFDKISKAEELRLKGTINFISDYPRQNYDTRLIYWDTDKELHINEMYYKKIVDEFTIARKLLDMARESDKPIERSCPYAIFVSDTLKISKWSFYDTKHQVEEFSYYLEKLLDTRLFKEEQDLLKERFEMAGLKVKSGNKMGLKTMTGFLQDLKLPYVVISKPVKVNKKLETVWIITK